jgi:pre-mRNA-splicing factor CDC5/CEF1
MVRIQIKGGVWKNSEDEILKVAVMKYGKNQWARISSLLVRKSAKQCKARWFEWLDPSIKKTEWTREEEEKLLHLAKIMPTQWRTIAPIVGRTAAQCLEHYEKLLDAAQDREGDYDPSEDPRRLRPGEIDPNPEARPARPDARDMDEDEKEMLSEARARLANTKGKKAKRKAREKQLMEAKRLAALQKKRELRAAGIEIRQHKRKRKFGIDYNEEVPFEKRPTPGFFDVGKDRVRTQDLKNDPNFYNNVDLRELEGARRDEDEERERKKDAQRQKLHRKTDLPAHILQINKMNDPEFIQRRGALALPSPQITDTELHEIAKLGGVVAAPPVGGGAGATRTLLASYGGQTPSVPTPMRTPRTPMGRDTLLEEAQNLIAMTNASSSLSGGDNAYLHPSDYGGITPKDRQLATPSQLAGETPSRSGATPMRTPKGGMTPAATPARDGLNINAGMSQEEALAVGGRRAQKRKAETFQRKLASGLSALPKATNEYMLVKPELPDEVADKVAVLGDYEEDAEDAVTRIEEQAKALEEAILRKRHMVIQRSLPRPTNVNSDMGKAEAEFAAGMEAAEELLRVEVVAMLRYDAHEHPLDEGDEGPKKKKQKKDDNKKAPKLAMVEEEQLRAARDVSALTTTTQFAC